MDTDQPRALELQSRNLTAPGSHEAMARPRDRALHGNDPRRRGVEDEGRAEADADADELGVLHHPDDELVGAQVAGRVRESRLVSEPQHGAVPEANFEPS